MQVNIIIAITSLQKNHFRASVLGGFPFNPLNNEKRKGALLSVAPDVAYFLKTTLKNSQDTHVTV